MDTQARSRSTRAVPWLAPRFWLAFGVLAIGAAIAALRPAAAQENVASAEELRELVGPIALYPDDLVAIVLPASTYPLQVVQAARLLEDRKRDSSLKPNEDWDDSVVALLNYPEVIKLLNDDLDWTYDLGTAVLNQRADVLSAIQDFRDEAYAAGNLRSDERQTVARADDAIEIKPADPQVIYVPYYEPEQVVVYQPAPVYYYYPVAYPVYYYPYPEHYHFHTGFFWGVNTWFSIGWHSHYLHVYDPFYYGHPYYGHTYYSPFYVRNVYVNVNHYHYPNYVWEPSYRYGGRPYVRGSEGRVHTADRDRTPHRGALDTNATRTREGSANQSSSPQATRDTVQASRERTPNGRSTAPPPSGTSTQANAGSDGRSTRAQTPPGQTHGQTHQPVRQPSEPAQARARQPGASADASPTPSTRSPSNGTTRSGGGMSQALERSRTPAQANANARTSPGATRSNPSMARANPGVSQRASERSTGMPQESSRSAPPRYQQSAPPQREAPPPRQQSFDSSSRGGGASAQRSEPPAGGNHGNSGGNDGGSSHRGNSGGGNSGGGHGGGNSGGGHGGRTR
jgi:hypothetical protein